MQDVFEQELETYREKLPSLLAHQGKFVLVKGRALAGPFDTYEGALAEGYHKYKPGPFLVKRIESEEPIFVVTRIGSPCP